MVAVPWPDFLTGLEGRRFDAYALYWGADYPDPESVLSMLFTSDGAANCNGYSNPVCDEAVAIAKQALDTTLLVQGYRGAQRILLDDGAVIPVYFDRIHEFYRRGIGGIPTTAIGIICLETAFVTE